MNEKGFIRMKRKEIKAGKRKYFQTKKSEHEKGNNIIVIKIISETKI